MEGRGGEGRGGEGRGEGRGEGSGAMMASLCLVFRGRVKEKGVGVRREVKKRRGRERGG